MKKKFKKIVKIFVANCADTYFLNAGCVYGYKLIYVK